MTALARVSFDKLIELFFNKEYNEIGYCRECSNQGDCMICGSKPTTKYTSKFNNDLVYYNKIDSIFSIIDNRPAGFRLAIGDIETPSYVDNCEICLNKLKEKIVSINNDPENKNYELKMALVIPMVTNDPRSLHMINKQNIRLFNPFLIKMQFCDHMVPRTVYQYYDWSYNPDRPKNSDLVIYDNNHFFYQEHENKDYCNLYKNFEDIGFRNSNIIVRQKEIIPFNLT